MEIIKLEKISKIYKKNNEKINALNSITLKFETGKFYAIMGNSGSGKSTLLQCIGLLDEVTNGYIYINDKKVSDLDDDSISNIRKNNIGFVFQSFYLNPNMKAYENVMLPIFLDSKLKYIQKKEIAINILKYLGLEERAEHYPKEMSGGEQQRVAIARALINNPDIILADEPTGNLDSKNEEIIFSILKKLSESGKCVIVVSHNLEIKNYADVVLQMKDGVINNE